MEKSEQQREDPILPPHVKAEGMCPFKRPRFTLYGIAQELMKQNYYERCDYRDEAEDIKKKVCVEVPDFDGKIYSQVFQFGLFL